MCSFWGGGGRGKYISNIKRREGAKKNPRVVYNNIKRRKGTKTTLGGSIATKRGKNKPKKT